ncbi:hypothetical protein KKA17_09725 [bacterium]|nr:hypothetical protein [bacterium]MBU1884583.1 hypothetical protein [bacterium]
MRPLGKSEIDKFLSRFERFTGAEIKNITLVSPTVIEIKIGVQDSALAFDWIDLSLQLSNVSDANLLQDSKLSFLDMSEGMSIIFEDNKFAFCYGEYSSLRSAKDSSLFVICESIKYEELPFSG